MGGRRGTSSHPSLSFYPGLFKDTMRRTAHELAGLAAHSIPVLAEEKLHYAVLAIRSLDCKDLKGYNRALERFPDLGKRTYKTNRWLLAFPCATWPLNSPKRTSLIGSRNSILQSSTYRNMNISIARRASSEDSSSLSPRLEMPAWQS